MNAKEAYGIWSDQYDTNQNKTRDVEAIALKTTLEKLNFNSCLEIGCGTGKNTTWLVTKASEILAIDISDAMLSKARQKINSDKVTFMQADITCEWTFTTRKFDMVGFSLVLEHIENLDFIFSQVSLKIQPGGYLYIGELHPFKQYTGSKARFETEEGLHIVNCFTHNISDFTNLAGKYEFEIVKLDEFFDDNKKNTVPRVLVLLFRKKQMK